MNFTVPVAGTSNRVMPSRHEMRLLGKFLQYGFLVRLIREVRGHRQCDDIDAFIAQGINFLR